MDQRIADFISANRGKYTRDAIRQQLIDAGYSPDAIDATWAILDTPDPDEAALAGEGFWSRFFIFLIGLNLVVFLLVALPTGMLASAAQGGFALVAVFGVALGIGALISWGIVAAVGPEKLGRTSALVIGGIVPILFALLIGGSCYALVGSMGPQLPPPRGGAMEVEIDPPMGFIGSGSALCQIQEGGTGFSIFAPEGVGSINGQPVHVSVDRFFTDLGGQEGGPAPAPAPGGQTGENVSMYITLAPRSETDPPQEWFTSPQTRLDIDVAPDGLSGTVSFEGLEEAQFEEEPAVPGGSELDTISGTVTWTCEEEQ